MILRKILPSLFNFSQVLIKYHKGQRRPQKDITICVTDSDDKKKAIAFNLIR